MANPTQTILRTVAALLLFVAACSKTAEGEQQRWDANVTEVQGLMAKYPGFKPALEARLAHSKTIYDEAAGLGEEAKTKKMSDANHALSGDFVRELGALEGTLEKLRKSRIEAAAKASDASSRLGADIAAQDAASTIERVEKSLATGAADEVGAKAVLEKITADVATAQAGVDSVLEVDREKKADAEADVEADAKAKAEAKAEVAPWKCEYCGTENTHENGACASCGAARGSKDAKAP